MAIELSIDPSMLSGKELVFDKTDGHQIQIEELQDAMREFYGDIQTMTMIKKGMLTVSLADFLMMPATGRTALDIFGKVANVKSTA